MTLNHPQRIVHPSNLPANIPSPLSKICSSFCLLYFQKRSGFFPFVTQNHEGPPLWLVLPYGQWKYAISCLVSATLLHFDTINNFPSSNSLDPLLRYILFYYVSPFLFLPLFQSASFVPPAPFPQIYKGNPNFGLCLPAREPQKTISHALSSSLCTTIVAFRRLLQNKIFPALCLLLISYLLAILFAICFKEVEGSPRGERSILARSGWH